jgi:dTDP-4-amino-4,6-dideoxygalactose transaminase
MSGRIPVLDLGPEIDALWDDLQRAIQSVIRAGQFILGPDVKAFESEVAAYLGVKHAIGMNSGTDALVIALRALKIGPGDEVITTPFTFIATAEAISQVGATPVFADIDPTTFNIDPAEVARLVTPRTRAILPVHLYGHAADMDALTAVARRHNLKIVEDVAQAFSGLHRGRKLGTIGEVGAFSFFPSKNLGAFGDAGMVTTNDDAVAEAARMLRAHGSRKKYYNEVMGYNSRMDTIQAAILRVKLPHIDAYSEGRRRVAAYYHQQLKDVPGLTTPHEADYATPVYHQYTVRIAGNRRDAVQQRLADEGIGTMVYYPVPVHKLPIYAGTPCSLPHAERACQEVLSLPIWPQMPRETQDEVVRSLREAVAVTS